jgi:hypothetical protein
MHQRLSGVLLLILLGSVWLINPAYVLAENTPQPPPYGAGVPTQNQAQRVDQIEAQLRVNRETAGGANRITVGDMAGDFAGGVGQGMFDTLFGFIRIFLARIVKPLIKNLLVYCLMILHNPNIAAVEQSSGFAGMGGMQPGNGTYNPLNVTADRISYDIVPYGVKHGIIYGFMLMRAIAVCLLLLLFIGAIWRYWLDAHTRHGHHLYFVVGRLIATAGLIIFWPIISEYYIEISNEMIDYLYKSINPVALDNVIGTIANRAADGAAFAFLGGMAGNLLSRAGATGLAQAGTMVTSFLCFLFLGITIFMCLSFIILKAVQVALIMAQFMFAPLFLAFFVSPTTERLATGFIRSCIEVSLWTFVWAGLMRILVVVILNANGTERGDPQVPYGTLLMVIGILQIMLKVPEFMSKAQISPVSDLINPKTFASAAGSLFEAAGSAVAGLAMKAFSSVPDDKPKHDPTDRHGSSLKYNALGGGGGDGGQPGDPRKPGDGGPGGGNQGTGPDGKPLNPANAANMPVSKGEGSAEQKLAAADRQISDLEQSGQINAQQAQALRNLIRDPAAGAKELGQNLAAVDQLRNSGNAFGMDPAAADEKAQALRNALNGTASAQDLATARAALAELSNSNDPAVKAAAERIGKGIEAASARRKLMEQNLAAISQGEELGLDQDLVDRLSGDGKPFTSETGDLLKRALSGTASDRDLATAMAVLDNHAARDPKSQRQADQLRRGIAAAQSRKQAVAGFEEIKDLADAFETSRQLAHDGDATGQASTFTDEQAQAVRQALLGRASPAQQQIAEDAINSLGLGYTNEKSRLLSALSAARARSQRGGDHTALTGGAERLDEQLQAVDGLANHSDDEKENLRDALRGDPSADFNAARTLVNNLSNAATKGLLARGLNRGAQALHASHGVTAQANQMQPALKAITSAEESGYVSEAGADQLRHAVAGVATESESQISSGTLLPHVQNENPALGALIGTGINQAANTQNITNALAASRARYQAAAECEQDLRALGLSDEKAAMVRTAMASGLNSEVQSALGLVNHAPNAYAPVQRLNDTLNSAQGSRSAVNIDAITDQLKESGVLDDAGADRLGYGMISPGSASESLASARNAISHFDSGAFAQIGSAGGALTPGREVQAEAAQALIGAHIAAGRASPEKLAHINSAINTAGQLAETARLISEVATDMDHDLQQGSYAAGSPQETAARSTQQELAGLAGNLSTPSVADLIEMNNVELGQLNGDAARAVKLLDSARDPNGGQYHHNIGALQTAITDQFAAIEADRVSPVAAGPIAGGPAISGGVIGSGTMSSAGMTMAADGGVPIGGDSQVDPILAMTTGTAGVISNGIDQVRSKRLIIHRSAHGQDEASFDRNGRVVSYGYANTYTPEQRALGVVGTWFANYRDDPAAQQALVDDGEAHGLYAPDSGDRNAQTEYNESLGKLGWHQALDYVSGKRASGGFGHYLARTFGQMTPARQSQIVGQMLHPELPTSPFNKQFEASSAKLEALNLPHTDSYMAAAALVSDRLPSAVMRQQVVALANYGYSRISGQSFAGDYARDVAAANAISHLSNHHAAACYSLGLAANTYGDIRIEPELLDATAQLTGDRVLSNDTAARAILAYRHDLSSEIGSQQPIGATIGGSSTRAARLITDMRAAGFTESQIMDDRVRGTIIQLGGENCNLHNAAVALRYLGANDFSALNIQAVDLMFREGWKGSEMQRPYILAGAALIKRGLTPSRDAVMTEINPAYRSSRPPRRPGP